MNRIKLVAILAVLGIVTFVAMSSIYTVSEVEQAIITQFGKPVGAPVTRAGLKVKVPFIQDVNLIDKRVLEWDGNPTDMPTKDKLYISVDLFARWRIAGPVAELVGIEGGVVSGVFNLESSDVGASDRRPRHEERYHEV